MSVTATPTAFVHRPEEAERRWFHGGGEHTWLARAEDTGGAYLLFSDVMTGGKCTPLHTHPADESLYVVDGEILVHLDGTEHRAGTGSLVLAPQGVPHAFLVTSATATILTLHTPGTCQDFYLAASVPLTAGTEREVDFDLVRAAADRCGGIEILGPPPFGTPSG